MLFQIKVHYSNTRNKRYCRCGQSLESDPQKYSECGEFGLLYCLMIDLSVIIVSWNAKDYLDDCISSIIKETIEYNVEIIVIDNASSDGSPEMVQQKYPSVTLICSETNLGFAKANNVGIKQCTGKYIFLINSDVTLIKHCINQMIVYMRQNPTIGVLGPKILNKNGKHQRSCMEYPTLWNIFCRTFALDVCFPQSRIFGGFLMTYWSHDNVRRVDTLNGCFWMVRRDALNQVGLCGLFKSCPYLKNNLAFQN